MAATRPLNYKAPVTTPRMFRARSPRWTGTLTPGVLRVALCGPATGTQGLPPPSRSLSSQLTHR